MYALYMNYLLQKLLNSFTNSQSSVSNNSTHMTYLYYCIPCKTPSFHWVPFYFAHDKRNRHRPVLYQDSMPLTRAWRSHYHCIWPTVFQLWTCSGNRQVYLFSLVDCYLKDRKPSWLSERVQSLDE